MRIEIRLRDRDARAAHYALKNRYRSKASLETLAKIAVQEIVAQQFRAELDEAQTAREMEELNVVED